MKWAEHVHLVGVEGSYFCKNISHTLWKYLALLKNIYILLSSYLNTKRQPLPNRTTFSPALTYASIFLAISLSPSLARDPKRDFKEAHNPYPSLIDPPSASPFPFHSFFWLQGIGEARKELTWPAEQISRIMWRCGTLGIASRQCGTLWVSPDRDWPLCTDQCLSDEKNTIVRHVTASPLHLLLPTPRLFYVTPPPPPALLSEQMAVFAEASRTNGIFREHHLLIFLRWSARRHGSVGEDLEANVKVSEATVKRGVAF